MELITVKFKNLELSQKAKLIQILRESQIPHDLEVFSPTDTEEWDDNKKGSYKMLMRAKDKIEEQIFKLKNNIN